MAASLAIFTLLAGIVGTTWGMFHAEAARADAANEAEQKRQALGQKEAALEDAKDKLFQALVNRARAERRSGRIGQRFEALKAVQEAALLRMTSELRTEAAAALILPDAEIVHEWEAWTEDTLNIAFDAHFERYARLDRHGGITVCRRHDGREEILQRLPPQGTPPFSGPYMSADGRYVTFCDHPVPTSTATGKVYVWKLEGPTPPRPLVLPVNVRHFSVSYRRDRRQLALGDVNRWVGVYDLDTGESVRRLKLGASSLELEFHPKDGRLAVAAGRVTVRCGCQQRVAALDALNQYRSVCWHFDGRRLATVVGMQRSMSGTPRPPSKS